MSVLGALFGGVGLATRGGGQPKPATPPIQASSKDEETFIQYVSPLRQMDISAINIMHDLVGVLERKLMFLTGTS